MRESDLSKSLSHNWLGRRMLPCPAIPPFTSITARQDDKKCAKAEARSRGPSTELTALPEGSGSLNHEEPEIFVGRWGGTRRVGNRLSIRHGSSGCKGKVLRRGIGFHWGERD